METVLVMLSAFVVGGLPFGVLVAHRVGVDLRASGSGNIGATNVARTAGRAAGVLVLVLDVAKGAGAAYFGWLVADVRLAAGAGFAAILGHVFSPFLGFRGGKGVATAAGAFSVLSPVGLLAALAVFAGLVAWTKRVSVGSLSAAVVLPCATTAFGAPYEVRLLAGMVAGVVVVRHLGNLKRLWTGTEPPFRAGGRASDARQDGG